MLKNDSDGEGRSEIGRNVPGPELAERSVLSEPWGGPETTGGLHFSQCFSSSEVSRKGESEPVPTTGTSEQTKLVRE